MRCTRSGWTRRTTGSQRHGRSSTRTWRLPRRTGTRGVCCPSRSHKWATSPIWPRSSRGGQAVAKIVGELGVEIEADSTGLAADIKAKVEAAVKEAATSQLALQVDTVSLARKLQDAIKAAKSAAGNIKIGVELSDDGFIPAVEAEVKKAQSLAGDVKFGVQLGVAGIDQAQ